MLLDRRARPTPLLSRYLLVGGRRRRLRRQEDGTTFYVDRLGTRFVAVLVAIFVFHVLDAVFTLEHLGRGASEMNPFMDYCLRQGTGVFLGVKLGMAGVGLFFLGLHKHFPYVKVGIAALFLLFAALVGYHCALFVIS